MRSQLPNERLMAFHDDVRNRDGHVLTGHDVLLAAARREDEAQIWFGDLQVSAALRGIRVLGTPLARQNMCRHSSRPPWGPMRCC